MKNEIWKSVKDYEGLYEVSNLGRIKSLSRQVKNRINGSYVRKEIILTGSISNKGYVKVILVKEGKKQQYSLHRIVMDTFSSNPQNLPQVNHKDTVKTNNAVGNLEWCDGSHNMKHAHKNGLRNFVKGETNPNAKLTAKKVLEIREVVRTKKYRTCVIASMFGISHVHAQDIIKRKIWKHI